MLLAWLTRLIDRRRGSRSSRRKAGRIADLLGRRGSFPDESAFLQALAAELASSGPLDESTVDLLATHLRGHCGEELDRIGPYLQAHLALWREIGRQTASPLAQACRADLLLRAGEPDLALTELLDALERDPGLVHFPTDVHQLARERGGEAWLRHRLAGLAAALAGDEDDDQVRELYGELLEEHRGDPTALVRILRMGVAIEEAAQRGELSRAIMRRGPRP